MLFECPSVKDFLGLTDALGGETDRSTGGQDRGKIEEDGRGRGRRDENNQPNYSLVVVGLLLLFVILASTRRGWEPRGPQRATTLSEKLVGGRL